MIFSHHLSVKKGCITPLGMIQPLPYLRCLSETPQQYVRAIIKPFKMYLNYVILSLSFCCFIPIMKNRESKGLPF